MEPQSPPTPAWHQMDYDPPPRARPRTPRQEPQWHIAPPTLHDVGYGFKRVGRGLRSAGSDVWAVGVQSMSYDMQRFRAFMQYPPRWFWVLLIASGIFVDMFFACSGSGVVAEQARWLRSLMP